MKKINVDQAPPFYLGNLVLNPNTPRKVRVACVNRLVALATEGTKRKIQESTAPRILIQGAAVLKADYYKNRKYVGPISTKTAEFLIAGNLIGGIKNHRTEHRYWKRPDIEPLGLNLREAKLDCETWMVMNSRAFSPAVRARYPNIFGS